MAIVKYRGINAVFDPRTSKWVCGDKNDTHLGVIDDSVVTQYGTQEEWILYTPFIYLEAASIDEIEIFIIPGFSNSANSVAVSLTYDGVTFGTEYLIDYSEMGSYGTSFIVRRLGYVSGMVGFKFRGVSTAKMAFGLMRVTYS